MVNNICESDGIIVDVVGDENEYELKVIPLPEWPREIQRKEPTNFVSMYFQLNGIKAAISLSVRREIQAEISGYKEFKKNEEISLSVMKGMDCTHSESVPLSFL